MRTVIWILLFPIALVALPARSADARSWTDRTGRQVEADFVGFADGKVQIKRTSDGKTFFVPIERFSDADQQFVKSQTQDALSPSKNEAAAPPSQPDVAETAERRTAEVVEWDPETVPALSVPPKAGNWQPFYRDFDFSLAVQQYRNDPALATLVLRDYLAMSSIQWKEMDGDEKVERKHEITDKQKAWLKDAFDALRPAGISYCRWMQNRAVQAKDVRTAMAATLLWLKLDQMQELKAKDTDDNVSQAERIQEIIQFLGRKEPSRSIALLRGEIQGELKAEPQWTIANLSATWENSYSKSFGLSTLKVSPPEGMTFLRVQATVTNTGEAVVDAWSLPLYQDSPREFLLDSATNWWKDGVAMYQDSPPTSVEPRRLLTRDMVHLVTAQDVKPSEGATFLPSGVIPCHVVSDDCDVLMGSRAGTMLMFLALSKKAVNPGLIASGSWVGQGSEFPLDVYFAVPKSDEFDYSLYIMGNAPTRIPVPE